MGLVLVLPAASSAQARYTVTLPIQVEQTSNPFSWSEWTHVIAQVVDIWEPYGVNVCSPAFTRERCPTSSLLVHVRVGDRSAPPAPDTIGWIEFFDGRPDNVIRVSLEAARRALATGSIGAHRLILEPQPVRGRFLRNSLGRTIAHELGHYLLGTKAHTSQGLMRSTFPVTDLLDVSLSRFKLQPQHLPVLAAQTRLTAALPSRAARSTASK
jgi:hypothetical protein